ncbi:hypothetical protein CYLTODRAFT_426362, partial [Cylindrobasidium torrendii FP15055 ss-10]
MSLDASKTQLDEGKSCPLCNYTPFVLHDGPLLQLLNGDPYEIRFDPQAGQTKASIDALTAKLNDDVASLQRSIDLLTSQRDEIALVSRNLKSFFPPIHNLSPDVLGDIFALVKDTYSDSQDTDSDSTDTDSDWQDTGRGPSVAFTLASVCARWRQVALESPFLWACFDADWDGFKTRDGGWRPSVFALLLERVRDVSLDVGIKFASTNVHSKTLSSLIALSARWRRLDVSYRTSDTAKAFQVLNSGHVLAALEELHISLDYNIRSRDSDALNFTAKCPRLTRLYLWGQTNLGSQDHSDLEGGLTQSISDGHPLPWSQLLTLSCNLECRAPEIFAILRLTTRLETLDMSGSPDTDFVPQTGIVTLPHLKNLRCVPTSQMLRFLCCPILEKLDVSTSSGFGGLVTFLSNSKPPLKALLMATRHSELTHLRVSSRIAGFIPTLDEFVINSDDIVGCFQYYPDGLRGREGYVPLIKVITVYIRLPIDYVVFRHGRGIDIINCIRLYWPSRGLEAINIFCYCSASYNSFDGRSEFCTREAIRATPLFESIRELRAEGLKVTLAYAESADPESTIEAVYHNDLYDEE